MKETKVQSISRELNIMGLTDKDLENLGYWYSYFTYKREKSFKSGDGITLGSPILNENTIKKGLMFFSNILNKLDEFDSTLVVESLNKNNSICFKCNNKNGENLVVNFICGDLIDHPTSIFIIDSNYVKRALITLHKGILLDKLSFSDLHTQNINEYYQKIYNEAYGEVRKKS